MLFELFEERFAYLLGSTVERRTPTSAATRYRRQFPFAHSRGRLETMLPRRGTRPLRRRKRPHETYDSG